MNTTLSHSRARDLALRESLRLQKARRDLSSEGPSGAQAVAALLKADKVDRYGSADRAGVSQTNLIAAEVDEPPAKSGVVHMLSCPAP